MPADTIPCHLRHRGIARRPHALTIFTALLLQDVYFFPFTPNPRPAYVVIIGPRGHFYHKSINKTDMMNEEGIWKV